MQAKKQANKKFVETGIGAGPEDFDFLVNPYRPIAADEMCIRDSYKDIAEITAYHSLNYLKNKLNITHEFFKGWKDALIGGSMKDRPMKGFIQVLQVLLFFVGGIVIIAIIAVSYTHLDVYKRQGQYCVVKESFLSIMYG